MTRGLSSAKDDSKLLSLRKMKITEFQSEVTKSGNGGHIVAPKDWIGKKVKVILLDPDDSE